MNTSVRTRCIRLRILDPRLRGDDGGVVEMRVRREKNVQRTR